MKFVVGENGRNPEKNLPRPRFVHHKTHMEGPRRELGTPAVGGERLTACATRQPLYIYIFFFQCSAQGQVLHCKLMHQGCNSAQRQVFHYKLRNLGCSFTRDE